MSQELHHAHDGWSDRHERGCTLRGRDDPLHEVGAMKRRLAAALGCLGFWIGPAVALEEPVVWRDADTGCAYILSPQGGIAARHRRDGSLDCPDVGARPQIVDDTARGIAQGLDALQRELERLRNRFNSPDTQRPAPPL